MRLRESMLPCSQAGSAHKRKNASAVGRCQSASSAPGAARSAKMSKPVPWLLVRPALFGLVVSLFYSKLQARLVFRTMRKKRVGSNYRRAPVICDERVNRQWPPGSITNAVAPNPADNKIQQRHLGGAGKGSHLPS